jgi:imidazolonepropionase-like amidohydrolase
MLRARIACLPKRQSIVLAALALPLCILGLCAGSLAQGDLAIVDITIIDGNGGKPREHATVLVRNGRITSISGATDRNSLPDATRIDGRGKYLLPGFIDSNVHASVYGNAKRRETVVKYGHRNEELITEFVQRQLKYGVTTIRDSFGSLVPLTRVRDRINSGSVIGPRMLVAGNIVGWGGPFSLTFSLIPQSELTLFQEKWNDSIAQGAGEDLMDMGPDELRDAINKYLDKGPDFIKFGGTSHFRTPSLIGFSPRAQRIIVEETHKRGLAAETHATSSEALRIAVDAGIDLIQHPEILSRDYPDDLIDLIVSRGVICGIRSNTLAGKPWQDHLLKKAAAQTAMKDLPPPETSAERHRREDNLELSYEIQRRNAERLIDAGCTVSIATDNYQGDAPEFRRDAKSDIQEAGIGSILAIEGLVELGMTDMEAIVAATRNGAMAARGLEDFGTIDVGKSADIILTNENPLADIKNIRTLHTVIARGEIVDIERLPEQRLFYIGNNPAPTQ